MILASLIGHQVGGYFLSMSIGHQVGGFFYNIQNKRNTTASCILHWYVKSPSHQGMPDAYQEKIVLQLLHPSVLLRVMRPNPYQRSNRTQALTCLHEQMPLSDFDGIVLLLLKATPHILCLRSCRRDIRMLVYQHAFLCSCSLP